VELPRPAELYDLAEALGGMSAELARREEDLGAAVDARTRELQDANAQLQAEMARREQAERKQRALEQRIHDAEKLESLGALAGGVAHDFNNLLAVIAGNAELALADLPPGHPQAGHLAAIRTATFRAGDIARRMLAFTGQAMFRHERTDLNGIAEAALAKVRPSLAQGVELVFEPGEGRIVACDPRYMRDAVEELLRNAAEAIKPDEGRITVRTGSTTVNEAHTGDE
jgi:C4-dicarboxylate-specific signal transduction histidine kinase